MSAGQPTRVASGFDAVTDAETKATRNSATVMIPTI